ncbi:hypothetical protein HW115_16820 [Verrucomicrobiaceae bacterium N1E253]|uniref:Uncharacterized protein n=1 Tax=Oceaniferula marina TaxID=2748318 RepID=A0A851GQL7_9BACT|nr:hypothetical protein [Oceaniferula marina]NWK57287.1 hypothetical protein [Oceaniferula marina]
MNKDIITAPAYPPGSHQKNRRSQHPIRDLFHALGQALHTPQGCEIAALRAIGKKVPSCPLKTGK